MFSAILVPIDVNQASSWEKALPAAFELCRHSGAKLTVMSVVPDFGTPLVAQYFPADYAGRAQADTKAALEKLVADTAPAGLEVESLVGYGSIYDQIMKTAKDKACDLIVMASHRPELKDYLIGPNAARVVRHAGCSVLVVRE